MDNAKKMLLIEPGLIDKINQRQNNSDNPLSRLDTEMQEILNSNIEDRKKCILYLQILQRYLHFNEESRQPIELPLIQQNEDFTVSNKKDETLDQDPVSTQVLKKEVKSVTHDHFPYTTNNILKSIPKTYLKKGESLLNLISLSKNKINWNNEDGVVMIDDKTIPGTNINDLINDLVRPLKRSDPIGWETFAKALKDIKIPLIYLGNPNRIEYIKNLTLKELGEISTDEEYSTPSNKYAKKNRKKLDWEKWSPY